MKKQKSIISLIISMLLVITFFSGCSNYSNISYISKDDAKKAAQSAIYDKAEERFGHIDSFGYGLSSVYLSNEDDNFYYFRGEMALKTDDSSASISVEVEVNKISGVALVTYFL